MKCNLEFINMLVRYFIDKAKVHRNIYLANIKIKFIVIYKKRTHRINPMRSLLNTTSYLFLRTQI